ncbi:hypothetical protein CEXT_547061 [Caerostris extrusa]|uniref:CRAL-TRIO domain-containing protein n=1 Tax=Caerostris extrusa TaxID=172846 RepID=A0AAV4PNM4_CAEEX|nr:hypothetical protein CEXT_547061 [Caerostris extrusa]
MPSCTSKRCPEGCTIILCQFGLWDTSELSFEDFKRMALVMLFQILRDPMNQINGLKFIHDFSELQYIISNTALLRICSF